MNGNLNLREKIEGFMKGNIWNNILDSFYIGNIILIIFGLLLLFKGLLNILFHDYTIPLYVIKGIK